VYKTRNLKSFFKNEISKLVKTAYFIGVNAFFEIRLKLFCAIPGAAY